MGVRSLTKIQYKLKDQNRTLNVWHFLLKKKISILLNGYIHCLREIYGWIWPWLCFGTSESWVQGEQQGKSAWTIKGVNTYQLDFASVRFLCHFYLYNNCGHMTMQLLCSYGSALLIVPPVIFSLIQRISSSNFSLSEFSELSVNYLIDKDNEKTKWRNLVIV